MDWDSASDASTLVIVESPAKARTIQNFVDKDTYVIDFCAGHIRDLAKKAKEVAPEFKKKWVIEELKISVADLGVDVEAQFEPLYVPMEGKAEVST
jgi:DNA topoisomerase IA